MGLTDKLKSKGPSNEIKLLPSEKVNFFSENIIHVHERAGTIGCITLTNYRLHFAAYYGTTKMAKKCETEGLSVPLASIESIVKCTGFTPDKLKYYAFTLKCKDFNSMRFMHLPGASQQKANSRLYEIFESLIFVPDYSKLYCFSNNVTTFNSDYYQSPTYPKLFVVPKKISDQDLMNVVSFRSKGRIPAMVWKSPHDHPVIVRCSQPVIGVTGRRCLEDEKLIEAVRLANLHSEKVYILDARPQINAVANQVMGLGYEGTKGTYANCVLKFLGIENIHKMREAQKKLFKATMNETTSAKLDKASTIWLGHISTILEGVTEVVDIIRFYRSSVVVHCSDGWDRTSQLCALAEIALDPYYRTIQGFQILIVKEWLSFGHKFEQRTGHGQKNDRPIEHSPIFLQFLDATFQMMRLRPEMFEFNGRYLLDIIHHLYSCRFGTFLYDCERERDQQELHTTTPSLWTHLNINIASYRNSSYQRSTEIITVEPSNVVLWRDYYLYWRSFHGF
eukprot:gene7799-9149_t